MAFLLLGIIVSLSSLTAFLIKFGEADERIHAEEIEKVLLASGSEA
jgi:hypothetical protein